MGAIADRIRQLGRQDAIPSDEGSGVGQIDEREQAIIDRHTSKMPKSKLLQRAAQGLANVEIDTRKKQRAYAEKPPSTLAAITVDPAREMVANLGDRAKVLDTLRKLSPEQRQEALKLAPGIAQQLGDDRGGAVGRTLGALSRGISHGVSQPLAELVGLGGTAEEIEYIRQLDAAASAEFSPARPGDPWYERGPLQAVEMAPWMATVVGGAGIGRAAATGVAGRVAGSAAAGSKAAGAVQAAGQALGKLPQAAAAKVGIKGVPALTAGKAGELAGITAAAFPSMYAQEVDQLKALGMVDDRRLRLLAGGTAIVAGLVEGIVPNPFKAGQVSLTEGAIKAARQYLWNAAKNAPGEMTEEYLQGVTSGLGEHVAQYIGSQKEFDFGEGTVVKQNPVEKKSIADAFSKGWEQAKEAALPMAFLLGVPAVGGAGISALQANRLQRLQAARAKGFISAKEAKELGIVGDNRSERKANADAEIQQHKTWMDFGTGEPQGDIPPPPGLGLLDRIRGTSPQQAAAPPNVPPGQTHSTTQPPNTSGPTGSTPVLPSPSQKPTKIGEQVRFGSYSDVITDRGTVNRIVEREGTVEKVYEDGTLSIRRGKETWRIYPSQIISPLPQGAPNASQVPTNEGSPNAQGNGGEGSQVPVGSQVRGAGQDQGSTQPASQEPAAPQVQVKPKSDDELMADWRTANPPPEYKGNRPGEIGWTAVEKWRKAYDEELTNRRSAEAAATATDATKPPATPAAPPPQEPSQAGWDVIRSAGGKLLREDPNAKTPAERARTRIPVDPSEGVVLVTKDQFGKPIPPETLKARQEFADKAKPGAEFRLPDFNPKGLYVVEQDGSITAIDGTTKRPMGSVQAKVNDGGIYPKSFEFTKEAPSTKTSGENAPKVPRDPLAEKASEEAAKPPELLTQPTESKWQSETRSKLEAVPALKGAKIEADEKAGTVKVTRPDGLSTTIHFNADEELAKAAKEKMRNPKSVHGRYVREPGAKTGAIYLRSDANHTNILNQEVMHWLEDEGVVTKEEVEQYGGREAIAEKYGKWAELKQRKKDSVFQRIYDALEPVFSAQRRFFEEVGKRQAEAPKKPQPSWTEESQKNYVKQKRALTKAEGTKDPREILKAAEQGIESFKQFGEPDDWSRWERAKEDAEQAIERGMGNKQGTIGEQLGNRPAEQATAADFDAEMEKLMAGLAEPESGLAKPTAPEKQAKSPRKPRSTKKQPTKTAEEKSADDRARAAAKKEEAKRKMREAFGDTQNRPLSGFDPQIGIKVAQAAKLYIEAGALDFRAFIRDLVADFGKVWVEEKAPYFESAWRTASKLKWVNSPAGKVADVLTEMQNETTDTTRGTADQEASSGDRRDSQDAPSPANADVLAGTQTADGGEVDEAGDTGGVRNRPGGKVRPRTGKADPGGVDEQQRSSADSRGASSDDARGRGNDRAPRATRPNYHLTNPDAIIGGGPKAKFERNRKAIEIVRDIEESGRAPTAGELDTLAGYTGWGAFGQELFKGSWQNSQVSKGWEEQDEWLRIYLGEEDWKSAQQSIVNAHYTDPQTVTAMWDMLRRMGFSGGRVLEPSMGIGNFFSLMPRDLMDKSSLTGIELDTMTAKIAMLLHPQANIQQKGYQESQTPDNFYDVILSNVPFGNYPIADRRYKQDFSIHNYFFKRAFDQVKPGGVIAFLTSNTTMDGKTQAKLMRAQIAEQGDLVTAIRLPSGAFQAYAGTKVVADLIVIRKRKPGESPMAAQDWINVIDMDTPAGEQIPVNEYWEKNPQNILGTMTWGHGTTSGRPGMIVQQSENLQAMLDKAVESVPEGIINTERTVTQGRERANTTAMRQNSVISQDGELWIVKGEQLVPLVEFAGWYRKGAKKATIDKNRQEIEKLLDVREAMRSVLDLQAASEDGTKARAVLNRVYDTFVAKYGPIGKSAAAKHLRKAGDPTANTLLALEEKKGDKYVKRPIFERPTVRQRKKVEKPTINDAFAMERNRSLDLDIEKIAATANVATDEVIRQLESDGKIYKTGTGTYDAADVFLSGNMARKLRQLEAAKAEGIDGLERSIAAVRERLPEPVPYSQIEAKLGATWVEATDYADFIGYLLNEPATAIQVERRINGWKTTIPTDINNKTEAQHTHGHRGIEFNKLMNAAMNNATVKLTMPDPENPDSRIADPVATAEANAKIGELREKFSNWIWTSPERITRLSGVYNEEFNSTVTPEFDDVPLQFEGMTLQRGDQPFNLRKHQESAVWRGIVSGKGIFAHEVGTGKTLTIAALAMESRRLGLASKPLLLAHNANSMAVRNEVMEAYPNANVLYIDNLDAKNKSAMLQAIATEDWDLIVVPHSMAERFQLRPETVEALLKPEMDALEAAALEAFEESESSDYAKGTMPANLDEMDADDLKKLKEPTAKELVKERLKLRAKIDEAVQAMQKGEGMFFEDMGIDMVMVDEAHLFKKLPITTKQNIKGLNKTASQRGTMLMMLTDYVRNMNNGRGAYLFTGTPITNTINEIYNMMRFVMAEEMEASGVRGWDGWFNNFATQETLTELSSGGTWENFDRLSSFVNLPELRQMVGQYMDIVFADEMPEFRPRDTREGRSENPVGRPYKQVHNVTTEMLPAQESHSEQLKARYTTFKNATGKDKVRMMREAGGQFNPLVIEGEGVKLAMDPRLVRFGIKVNDSGQLTTDETKLDPKDPRLKINRMLHNAMAHYQEHPQSAQMIFMQIGHDDWTTRTVGRTPAGKPITERVRVFNLAREIKRRLMEEGVPENEIAMFSTMSKEKRTETAQLMKEGKVRFAIGSTETMGTGVNAQDELIAMHHLDAPWMPGDLEQRNGRGHRQGNKWNTVHEYRYLTEGPQDGRRWQVLLTKSRFIEKFMKADGTERTIEMDDVDMSDDGAGNDMEKTFAAAAGDPRIMMRIRLEDQVAKLERSRDNHARTITETVSRANQKLDNVERQRATIKEMQDDYQTWLDNRPEDKPTLTLSLGTGAEASKVSKAITGQQEINDALKDREERYRNTIAAEVQIGEYRGLPLFMNNGMLFVGNGKQRVAWSLASLQGVMANTPERIAKIENGIEKDERFIEMAHKAVGEPFPKQKQLDSKRARLNALLEEMESNPDISPAWLRAGAPIGTAVFHKGIEYEVSGHRKDTEVLYSDGDKFVALPAKELTDKDGTPLFPELQEEAAEEPQGAADDKPMQSQRAESQEAAGESRLDAFTSPELQDRQSMGAAKMRIASAADLVGDEGGAVDGKYASPDKEFERRWQMATRGIGKKTLATKLREFWQELVKSTVRGSLPELPRTEQFGEARSAMHAYQNAPTYAQLATADLLKKTSKPLSAEDYDLFTRIVIMRDQAEAADKGERLSYGLTPAKARAELARVESLAAGNERVQASLEYRKQWTEAMVDDFLSAHEYLGLDMTDRFKRENYFRHQVLYYMEAQQLGLGKKKVELTPNRGWLKGRTSGDDLGEAFDINANYLQAEWEVSTQMIADTKRAQAIGRLKRHYDKMRELKEEAKYNNYVAVVGGQENMDEIEELRGMIAELRESGPLDSGEKAQIKEWSERIWELDPTMPFRQQMAIASEQIERGAASLGEEVPDDFMRYVASLAKQEDSPLQPLALSFLKAVADRKAFIKNALGNEYQTWEDVVPDDYEEVAIRPGRAMFQAYSVPEQVASELMADLSKTLGISAEDLRPLTAMGSKYTPLVVPQEVAAQMAAIDNKMDFGWLDHLVTRPMNAWKRWVLMSPTRVLKYNLRNLSEIDKVMSLNPAAIKDIPRAVRDLWKLYSGADDIPATVRDWVERGGSGTLVRVNELGDLNELKEFARLIADKKSGVVGKVMTAPANAWRFYWSKVGLGSDFRESILRYAAYLNYLEQLEAGKLTNYGGSVRAEVDGIKDKKDKAMRLSADLLGDYGDISLVGQFLRSRLAPFWSFQETNVRTYFRGLINLASNEQSAIKAGMHIARAAGIGALAKAPFLAYKLGRIAILFYGLKAMTTAFNQLLFPDNDDELPEEEKRKAHLTFGKNAKGEVQYFSRIGTAADVLDWIGLDSVDYDLRDVLDGRRTLREVLNDMARSPVDKAYGMLSPFIKMPTELAVGQTAYPNVGKPRPIRDRGRYIAQNLGIQKEYDKLVGNPSTPYSVTDTFLYKVEPGTSVYYLTLDAKYRWLKEARNRGIGYSTSARGDALRNYKMALRLNDKTAADKYLAVYEASDGTKEGLLDSLESSHPAGGLSTIDAYLFYKSLSPTEQQEYREAERFYYSELLTDEQAKQIRARRDKRLKDIAIGKNKDGSPKGKPQKQSDETAEKYRDRMRAWQEQRKIAQEALQEYAKRDALDLQAQ